MTLTELLGLSFDLGKKGLNMTDEEKSGNAEPQDFSSEEMQAIAKHQKGVLICIALYLLCVIGQFVVPSQAKTFVALGALVPIIGGAVFVFMLATKVYNTVSGVLLGIVTLVPILGLIVLLVINGRATKVLRNADVSVGLFGANLSEL